MQDDEDVVIAKMVISQATALLFCGVIWSCFHQAIHTSVNPFGFLRMALQTISLPTLRSRGTPRSTSIRPPGTSIRTTAGGRPRTSSVSSRSTRAQKLVQRRKWHRRVPVLYKRTSHLHRRLKTQNFWKTSSNKDTVLIFLSFSNSSICSTSFAQKHLECSKPGSALQTTDYSDQMFRSVCVIV
jgi:hypothetical protein